MSLESGVSDVDRSFIIPVLDYSPHSPYNIRTLLHDLEGVRGEVICVFNSRQVFEDLAGHPRIDKYCFNNLNPGVSRSWNIGLALAEGRYGFILNADLHISAVAIDELEGYLRMLDRAVIVGPEGSDLKFENHQLSVGKHCTRGTFSLPQRVDNVSGFCMAVDLERFFAAGLGFDTRFSPCFMEEWDIGLQVMQAGLACYIVPVGDYEHHWGISRDRGQTIRYFGRELTRAQIMEQNGSRFMEKWQEFFLGRARAGG